MSSTRLKSSPSGIAAAPPRSPTQSSGVWWPWIVTFLAFPPAGWLGWKVAGRVNDFPSAVFAGVITGVVLGVLQWALLRRRGVSARWILGTAPASGSASPSAPPSCPIAPTDPPSPSWGRSRASPSASCRRPPSGLRRGSRSSGVAQPPCCGPSVDAQRRRDRCRRPVARLWRLRCPFCRLRAEPVHQARPADQCHAGTRRAITMNVEFGTGPDGPAVSRETSTPATSATQGGLPMSTSIAVSTRQPEGRVPAMTTTRRALWSAEEHRGTNSS